MGSSGDLAFLQMRAAILMKQLAQEFPDMETGVLVLAAVEALLETLGGSEREKVIDRITRS